MTSPKAPPRHLRVYPNLTLANIAREDFAREQPDGIQYVQSGRVVLPNGHEHRFTYAHSPKDCERFMGLSVVSMWVDIACNVEVHRKLDLMFGNVRVLK